MKQIKPQRILIVSYDFPPRTGGVSTCCYQVCKALQANPSVQIKVISAAHFGHQEFDRDQPFAIKRVMFALQPRVASFLFAAQVAKEILFWQPSSIVNLLWFPDGLATLLAKSICFWNNTPYFLFAHGVEVLESRRGIRKQIRANLSFIKKAVFAKASGVWAVSRYTKKIVHQHCAVPLNKIEIVNNGVSCDDFYPTERPLDLLKKFSIDNRKIFFTVARLDDYKGIDQSILAVKELSIKYPKLLYLIAGSGSDRPRLERLVLECALENQVKFLGKVSDKDLLRYYNLADCFLLACREDLIAPNVEGFGIVFLEASACGKPVIAGAGGGVSDAVEDGYSGWLVDPCNPKAIAAQMEKVINDEDAAKKIGDNGRRRVQAYFTWEQAADKLLKSMDSHVRN